MTHETLFSPDLSVHRSAGRSDREERLRGRHRRHHRLFEQGAHTASTLGRPAHEMRWRRRVRWGVNIALSVMLVAVALVCYGLINNRWYHIVVVKSGSMSPTIQAGDAIVITPPPDLLEQGMVVTMQVDGKVVTHRVIRVDEDGEFTTQGDANPTADDWGDLNVRVAGVQRLRLPLVGQLLTALGAVDKSGAFFLTRSTVSGQTASASCFIDCSYGASESPTAGGTAQQMTPATPRTDPTREANGASAGAGTRVIASAELSRHHGELWLALTFSAGDTVEGPATKSRSYCPDPVPLTGANGETIGDRNGNGRLDRAETWPVRCFN